MTLSTSSTSSPLGVLSVLVLGMIALLLSPRLASAQVATASINGAVGDASGAGVPRARVVLRNEVTNVTQTTTTGDTGTYVLVNIIPGRYTLTASKEGFATGTTAPFDLAVNQSTTIDVTLRIGSATEAVVVEASATSIQTSSSELGTVIGKRSVDNLPLNGRHFKQLLNVILGTHSAPYPSTHGIQTPEPTCYTSTNLGPTSAVPHSCLTITAAIGHFSLEVMKECVSMWATQTNL